MYTNVADALSVIISVSLYLMVHAGTVLNLYSGLYCLKMVNAYLGEIDKCIGLTNNILEGLTQLLRKLLRR
jgi:hypothetical protein